MSRADKEAEAIAARQKLQASLAQLRQRLAPGELAHEIGGSMTDRLTDASQKVSAKAATPGGVVAMAGVAFASAFAASGGMSKPIPRAKPIRALTVDEPSKPVPRDTVLMLAQLSAAVAAGAVASRFIPISRTERELLDGVGPELRHTIQTKIEAGTRQLASPSSPRLGPLNLAAMLAAAVLTRRA